MNKLFYLTPILSLILVSCLKDSPDDLNSDKVITIPEVVTYDKDVKQIFDANCISCHSADFAEKGLKLDNFNDVKNGILNRGLVDRISRESNDDLLMPQGGPKLSNSSIEIIKKWQANGLLEK